MKMPDLPFKLPDMPKKVAISTAILVCVLVLFAILYFTLGIARDSALERVAQLTAEAQRVDSNVRQSAADYEFVTKGKDRYEKLIAGTKLIPHTRRNAVEQMQALGREFGMSTVNYNFQGSSAASPQSVTAQPRAGEYKVSVETIEVALGAPTDGIIYGFVASMLDDFPGAIILDKIELARSKDISQSALNDVARGRGALVTGKALLTWRTAQKVEEPK